MTAVALTLERSRRPLELLRWGGAAALTVLAFLFALGLGPTQIPLAKVVAALLDAAGLQDAVGLNPRERAVVIDIRLPRVCLGMLIGAALAMAGTITQGLFRNPLADPALIGISGGAALGAVAAIVFAAPLAQAGLAGPHVTSIAAFLGASLAAVTVWQLGRRTGVTDITTVLLGGIAVNALALAMTGFMIYLADDRQLRDITFWTMGSLGGSGTAKLAAAAPFIILPLIGAFFLARSLDALLLGERAAAHLGVVTARVVPMAIAIVAMVVGASVASAGIIGFVGIVTPHLARLMFGQSQRRMLPASGLLGACLVMIADTVARMAVAPAELPIGLLCSACGAPFFLWLLRKRRSRDSW